MILNYRLVKNVLSVWVCGSIMDCLVYAYVSALGLWFSRILIKFVSNKIYLSLLQFVRRPLCLYQSLYTEKHGPKMICASYYADLSNM